MIEIKVPPVGESINEVTLVKWTKPDGAWVERDDVLCELERHINAHCQRRSSIIDWRFSL
jgi:hypothetical protein